MTKIQITMSEEQFMALGKILEYRKSNDHVNSGLLCICDIPYYHDVIHMCTLRNKINPVKIERISDDKD